ncbi:MAG: potassium-transporting ATPase subunit KdpB [Myxococcaceae bacterium]
MKLQKISILSPDLLKSACYRAVVKLNPAHLLDNPVMFVTWMGALVVTISLFWQGSSFELQIALWLWFTVLFANFAESLAECQGKAQAESLRKNKISLMARLKVGDSEQPIQACMLKKGDLVICEAGDFVPADGEITEGIASVDESAITGESAPVIRESGGDRSGVTGGTQVISDRLVIRVTSEPGNSFLDRMISLIEGAKRQKTPNELALNAVLIGLTVILSFAVFSLWCFGKYSGLNISIVALVALWVCLIPTTIGGLLSAIGIAGMDRLIRKNVIAKSGRAIEAAGDINILLLDKTGTITLGNRMAADFIAAEYCVARDVAHAAALASLSDETAEGRSILALAKERFKITDEDLVVENPNFIQFSANTRLSGVDLKNFRIRKGAIDAIRMEVLSQQGQFPEDLESAIVTICQSGGTPLAVLQNNRVLGVIHLKDIIKTGIKDRFAELHRMGIKTIMMTGDNALTAAAIAAEAGISDFIAQATPETKLLRIKEEQKRGSLVAMTGDGTNDAPALAQADVGLVMGSGTQAAREAGNMVDLDSDPTKILDVVSVGKQLLMTRGALTTFSIANDLAKYFAILPAMFGSLFILDINLMGLGSSNSAILSSVIYNAVIIILLVPLALRGVPYRAASSAVLLRHNLLVYGLGGIVAPFIGIKLIDYLVQHWV